MAVLKWLRGLSLSAGSPVVKERLNRPNNVQGPFTLKSGRLTFRTADPALTQRDRGEGRDSTLCLLSVIQSSSSPEGWRAERPQEWQVVMVEQKPRKRT